MQMLHIAQVISGYAFRRAITPAKHSNTLVLQAGDIAANEPLHNVDGLTRVSDAPTAHEAYLKKNDVLLVARGMQAGTFKATVFTANEPNVIATSSLHIIRATNPNLLPAYLSLYLNSAEGQAALAQIVSGTYIGALSRKKVELLDIPLPPLTKQRTLVSLQENIAEQNHLSERQQYIRLAVLSAAIRKVTV